MIRGLIRQLDRSWRVALVGFMRSRDGKATLGRLDTLLNVEPVNYYPRGRDIFNAFRKTSFDSVRVVIIGQDPYPEEANATGIAFFARGNRTDSLDNIYDAVQNDLNRRPTLNCLKRWAEQEGVLLLNSVLTIRKVGDKNMHNHKGWERFIGAVLRALSKKENPIHFILWGSKAQKFKSHINGRCYHIHAAPHPSPRNNVDNNNAFLNCRHFSAVNNALGDNPINWLPPQED